MKVGLHEGCERYDFEWPVIVRYVEEELTEVKIDINSLQPFTAFSLDMLRKFLATDAGFRFRL